MSNWFSSRKYIFIGTFLFLIVIIGIYFFFFAPDRSLTLPEVAFVDTFSENTVSQNNPILLSVQANDPDGIDRIELWANGELISTQLNPNQEEGVPFYSSHVWKALDPGNYSLFARAYDAEGFSNDTGTKILSATERVPTSQDDAATSYFVQEGDTLESIAERFGTDGEHLKALNPSLSEGFPSSGTPIYAPHPAASEGNDEDDDVPGVSAQPGAGSATGGAPAAQLASPPPWAGIIGSQAIGSLNNRIYTVCQRIPLLCNLPAAGQSPPAAPTDVSVMSNEQCLADIRWQDQSDNESGFQIVRVNTANQAAENIVARLEPQAGTGPLSFQDEVGAPGDYLYYVQAHNAAGKSSSAPSQVVQINCDQPPGNIFPIRIEMVSLNVEADIDFLHCFIAVADQPYNRVPSDGSEMTVQARATNIGDLLGGENSLEVLVDPISPLEIRMDCVEHVRPPSVGGLLQAPPSTQDLGNFANSHPTEEWDGRVLTGTSSLGQFSVEYRISSQPLQTLSDPNYPDHTLQAPQWVGNFDWWFECSQSGLDYPDCVEHDEPGSAWEWEPPADANGNEAHAFQLFVRGGTQSEWTLIYESDHMPVRYIDRNNFVPRITDEEACDRFPVTGVTPEGQRYSTIYSVVRVEFASYNTTVVSPFSAPSGAVHYCDPDPVMMEVTLLDLTAGEIKDAHLFAGTPEGEMYGSLYFGYEIRWNAHPMDVEPNAHVSPPPLTQTLIPGKYSWESMALNIEDPLSLSQQLPNWSPPDGFQFNNNRFYVPYFTNSTDVAFFFKEHDGGILNGDDIWCIGFYPWAEGSREDWLARDETVTIEGSGFDGTCSITVHLKGMRVSEGL